MLTLCTYIEIGEGAEEKNEKESENGRVELLLTPGGPDLAWP